MNGERRDISTRFAKWKWSKERMAKDLSGLMLYVRPGMEGDLEHIAGISGSVLIYSMWDGYKKDARTSGFLDACENLGIKCSPSLHTSGHAVPKDLERLVESLRPKQLIPIHTEHPERYDRFGVPRLSPEDCEPITLGTKETAT